MHGRLRVAGLPALLVIALLALGCSDLGSPERRSGGAPTLAAMAGTGIVLDQQNGAMGTATPMGSGTHIGDGFIPTNPHHGDAIVATFFWRGSTNVITTVTDHLADGTPVGNTYTLVEYVTSGGMSMATYVATNVQNFPDPRTDDNGTLDVHALTSSPVTGEGIIIAAYSGVAADIGQALGSHRSAVGSGSSPTTADPGAIPADAGALAYGITLANAPVGIDPPGGFTNITNMSDASTEADAEYAVQSSAGSVDPQWTWYFNAPSTWLASVLTLNPAESGPGNQPPVVDAGPDETAVTGSSYSLTATFSDPDNDGPWSYTINWGDGSTTTGSASSQGTISAGHTYVTLLPKSFTITVTVTDSHGASASDTKVVSVLLR